MSSLRSYLVEVIREYERVLGMYRVFMSLGTACGSSEYVGVLEAALVESILMHSRSLIQFFKIVKGRRYKDVIYYLHTSNAAVPGSLGVGSGRALL